MLAWFQSNLPTILIIAVLVLFFALLIRSLIKDKKKGKSSCCGGCSGCAMAGQCHGHVPTAEAKTAEDSQDTPNDRD